MTSNYKKSEKFSETKCTISQIAEHYSIHQRTLRIYDNENLVSPQRSSGNRRLYGKKEFQILDVIIFLSQRLNVNLAGIKIIFELLKKFQIQPSDSLDLIEELATSLNIDIEKNYFKYSNKGRPKTK